MGEFLGFCSDTLGLVGCLGKIAARRSLGFPKDNQALYVFERYGKDSKMAALLEEKERKEYDELVKNYPGGYAEYKKKMDEFLRRDRERYEERYRDDPMGALYAEVSGFESARINDAKWARAVDRENGIYRPKSCYGL